MIIFGTLELTLNVSWSNILQCDINTFSEMLSVLSGGIEEDPR